MEVNHDFIFANAETISTLTDLVFMFDYDEAEKYLANHPEIPRNQIELALAFHPLLESYLENTYTDQAGDCAYLPHHSNYPGFET